MGKGGRSAGRALWREPEPGSSRAQGRRSGGRSSRATPPRRARRPKPEREGGGRERERERGGRRRGALEEPWGRAASSKGAAASAPVRLRPLPSKGGGALGGAGEGCHAIGRISGEGWPDLRGGVRRRGLPEEARHLGTGEPRRARPPPRAGVRVEPRRALPPPRVGVPGEPSTGREGGEGSRRGRRAGGRAQERGSRGGERERESGGRERGRRRGKKISDLWARLLVVGIE